MIDAGISSERKIFFSKKLWVPIVLLVGGYFFILPIFWLFLEPSISISVASEWEYNKNLPIHVRISAFHKNFAIRLVRITFEYDPSFGKDALYPIELYSAPMKDRWLRWKINRFTFPISREFEFTLPLEELATSGKLHPRTLKGQIQVSVDYVRGIGRRSSFARQVTSYTKREVLPYTLVLK